MIIFRIQMEPDICWYATIPDEQNKPTIIMFQIQMEPNIRW